MLDVKYARLLVKINWALLAINALVLLFFISRCLVSGNQVESYVRNGAALLGMDVYCAKHPFVVCVDKNYPNVNKYAFLQLDQSFSVSMSDFKDDTCSGSTATMKEACMQLGENDIISCLYSRDGDICVHEIILTRKKEILFDINADGVYDLRQPLDLSKKTLDEQVPKIWYKGRWQDVVMRGFKGKYGKDERELLKSGDTVYFDSEKGLWLSTKDRN